MKRKRTLQQRAIELLQQQPRTASELARLLYSIPVADDYDRSAIHALIHILRGDHVDIRSLRINGLADGDRVMYLIPSPKSEPH